MFLVREVMRCRPREGPGHGRQVQAPRRRHAEDGLPALPHRDRRKPVAGDDERVANGRREICRVESQTRNSGRQRAGAGELLEVSAVQHDKVPRLIAGRLNCRSSARRMSGRTRPIRCILRADFFVQKLSRQRISIATRAPTGPTHGLEVRATGVATPALLGRASQPALPWHLATKEPT